MIIDGRTLAENTAIETDICIIGGGPAGLTLASRFSSSLLRTTILEAGGLEGEPQEADFLAGRDITGEYEDLQKLRCSQLGGTMSLWNMPFDGEMGAKYVPLDEIDFKAREAVPYSGWPFSKTELDPYYEKAQELCGLGKFRYDAEFWADSEARPFSLEGGEVVSKVYQLGRTAPFQNLIKTVGDSPKVETIVNLRATELVTGTNGARVVAVRAMSDQGKRIVVKSRIFILAAGGIENARLLLLTRDKHPDGLGNEHSVVGRYLMDHPIYFFTEFLPQSPRLIRESGFYDARKKDGAWVLGRMTLSENTLMEKGLLNLSVILYPRLTLFRSLGVEAFREMRWNYRRRDYASAAKFLPAMMMHGADIARFVALRRRYPELERMRSWYAEALRAREYSSFEPEFCLEQPPDPENRVTLSSERDTLGVPRTNVHWRWGKSSRESAERAAAIFNRNFQDSGWGSVRKLRHPRLKPSGHHHLGTTRMHVNPKFGVVDENCKVHGLENLFISGSSVFPTGGYANPTLTIVALAFRLVDHLQSKNILFHD